MTWSFETWPTRAFSVQFEAEKEYNSLIEPIYFTRMGNRFAKKCDS
jgi:hypothetical protein